ncbi:MAG: hypothetical protein F9K48_11530 [Candidatus Brocadia sp.]|nr:MAG: hypothetical protein F9K48_11530 [Candidatus Brocadia sp.]
MRYLLTSTILLLNFYGVNAFADVSYADLFLSGRGYKPVGDTRTEKPPITHPSPENSTPDNPLYREWCTNTFHNGKQIYEAYKEIAFDINYRSEPPKADYWQTPLETRQRKKGDCEDSVFLFFSQLSELNIDGDVVWGWVVDKGTSVAFAHVWYQLFDKRGRAYIVEGFSKEWNGIIPEEMISGREERMQTLVLRHNQIHCTADKMIPKFTDSFEDEQCSWSVYLRNNTALIKGIFQKLADMFTRYGRQKSQASASIQQSAFSN